MGSQGSYLHSKSLAEPHFLLIKFTVGDSSRASPWEMDLKIWRLPLIASGNQVIKPARSSLEKTELDKGV